MQLKWELAVPAHLLQIQMANPVDITTQSMQRLVETQRCNMQVAHLLQLVAGMEVQAIGHLLWVAKVVQAVRAAVLQVITQGLPVKMVVVRLVKVTQALVDMVLMFPAAAAALVLQVIQVAPTVRLQAAQALKIVF
jgi:hypothetical protein